MPQRSELRLINPQITATRPSWDAQRPRNRSTRATTKPLERLARDDEPYPLPHEGSQPARPRDTTGIPISTTFPSTDCYGGMSGAIPRMQHAINIHPNAIHGQGEEPRPPNHRHWHRITHRIRRRQTRPNHNVNYCPNARTNNLIFESRLNHKGLEITKRNGRRTIKKPDGRTIIDGRLRGYLYKINLAPPTAPSKGVSKTPHDTARIGGDTDRYQSNQ
ncbi:hypothetical protein L210DRAFT_2055942 [Boletus edulis BED1]|uniref:Uncharacterized protein n=1 Tax=Boletus edulis BED1 TaxID=1328754 RepID=A0AAD4C964_BOLED|nr:hypothetical protein L210DRAFT_2055942 [Boletus edulis BED1]